jgi:hypothetical protein
VKKSVLSIDEPEPKKTIRADRPPTEGFATIVDGHFKAEFGIAEAAETSGRTLKLTYPRLQIEIYDAVNKVPARGRWNIHARNPDWKMGNMKSMRSGPSPWGENWGLRRKRREMPSLRRSHTD